MKYAVRSASGAWLLKPRYVGESVRLSEPGEVVQPWEFETRAGAERARAMHIGIAKKRSKVVPLLKTQAPIPNTREHLSGITDALRGETFSWPGLPVEVKTALR